MCIFAVYSPDIVCCKRENVASKSRTTTTNNAINGIRSECAYEVAMIFGAATPLVT